jgi:hypothetical protein
MKTIIKHYSLTTLFSLLLVYSNAQNGRSLPPPEDRAKKITEWMKTNLQLSDAQVAQVEPINLKYANKAQELQGSTSPKKQKLLVLKDIETAKDEELKKVLTPDQFKTYSAKKEELKQELKKKAKSKRNT